MHTFQHAEFKHRVWRLPVHLPYAFQFADLVNALGKYEDLDVDHYTIKQKKDIKHIIVSYFSTAESGEELQAWETILFAAVDYPFKDNDDVFYIPEVENSYKVSDVYFQLLKLSIFAESLDRDQASTEFHDIRKSLVVGLGLMDNFSNRLDQCHDNDNTTACRLIFRQMRRVRKKYKWAIDRHMVGKN